MTSLLLAHVLRLPLLVACGGGREAVDTDTDADSAAADSGADSGDVDDSADDSADDSGNDVPDDPVCGDGAVEGTEVCDDGNTADVDGCLHDCSAVSACVDEPPSASVLDLFPDSGAPVQTGAWTLGIDHAYVPGTEWAGLDETSVFQARLVHAGDVDWELRVGKGSQIYSLRTAVGELVPEQRAGDAEWVDEVIQSVLVNTDLDEPTSESTKYQIHQAGCYRRDADFDVTFYSPMLDEDEDAAAARYASLVWPQQAHVPSNYRSRLMLAQQLRDLGAGVIEVTQVFVNFGDEEIDYVAAPWLPLRNSAVPLQVVSLPADAGEAVQQGDWCSTCDIPLLEASETAGWFAHLAVDDACADRGDCALDGSEEGIAIVFGLDDSLWYRWGTHPTRDLTVSTAMRIVSIGPRSAWTLRYFLIVGDLDTMRTLAPGLRGYATLTERVLPGTSTPVVPLCEGTTGAGQQVLRPECADAAPLAQAFRNPVDQGLPLFSMTEVASGRSVLSVDPYALTDRPHDGSTTYDGLLGWGLREGDDACYASVVAGDIATDRTYFPLSSAEQQAVRLRTSAGLTCACP